MLCFDFESFKIFELKYIQKKNVSSLIWSGIFFYIFLIIRFQGVNILDIKFSIDFWKVPDRQGK